MDLEKLEQNILNELERYQYAWSQWPGNTHTDTRAEVMRIAIALIKTEFSKAKGENNEKSTH